MVRNVCDRLYSAGTSILFLVFAVIFVGLGACSSGKSFKRKGYDFSKVKKVAVVKVSGDLKGDAEANYIADQFNQMLLKTGYAPVERGQIETVLKEQEFQESDLSASGGAAKVGDMLNVNGVIIVNVPRFEDSEMSMSAKMINVKNGGIIWSGSGDASADKGLAAVGGAAAGATAGGEAGGTGGAIAGGAAGGAAAAAMSPERADLADSMIEKITEKLPDPTK